MIKQLWRQGLVTHRHVGRFYVAVELRVVPQDVWVGCYWKRYPMALDLFFCVIPLLPLNIYLHWRAPQE